MNFTSDQERQKVIDSDSHVLVMGGPGSGKTTLALAKAVHKIENGLGSEQEVLFLSFSRAAVARIADAARKSLSQSNQKKLNIQTFHSFFWGIIQSHGYLLGAPRRLRLLQPHDEKALSRGIKPNSEGWQEWLLERERLFLEEGKIAFDLFAPNTVKLLEQSVLVRKLTSGKFPLIIVDEAQDTGPDSWRCVELLAETSQVICLADLEQQIFDHLQGIGPERIEAIKAALDPLNADLGSQNNRSPDSEILTFANDVLGNRIRKGGGYKGVTRNKYGKKEAFDIVVRRSVGILVQRFKDSHGCPPESIAILAPYGSDVAKITAALNGNGAEKPIPHKVLFDETEVLLSSRFAAFLLEPKTFLGGENEEIATCLELLADIQRANGGIGALNKAAQYSQWAIALRTNKRPRGNLVSNLSTLFTAYRSLRFNGDPRQDWIQVKQLLRQTGDNTLGKVAESLDYLVAFNRGKRIAGSLADLWVSHGRYLGAREALDKALAQEQLLSDLEDLKGIHVMTIHKSKGKQFDAVILIRQNRGSSDGWVSSFVWREDTKPYNRSRRIVRVAITRACKEVFIYEPPFPSCPIIGA